MLSQLFGCVSSDEVMQCHVRNDHIVVDYEFKSRTSGCGQFEIYEPRRVVILWGKSGVSLLC
jgi:hypothetical protein